MKSLIVSVLFTCFGCAVLAQPAPEPASSSSMAVQRARIEQDRKREETRYAQEEAACYQRFAVNDCLREVRVRRRATFEDLKRQEISLNDEERKIRAGEQVDRTDEKASIKSSQEEADKRAAARQESQERMERAEQKKVDRQKDAAQKAGTPPRERSMTRDAPSEASKAEQKKSFEEKQRQALERKAERDKALAEKKKAKPASTLPELP